MINFLISIVMGLSLFACKNRQDESEVQDIDAPRFSDAWKNNPDFSIVYILTKPVGGLATGERVAISIRSIEDSLIRSGSERKIGLLKAAGEHKEDPGIIDASLPPEPLENFLKPTTDPAPLKHWEKFVADNTDLELPNIKPNYYYSDNFPANVYAAQASNGERPLLILSGFPVLIIKPSPHCKKDELTTRISSEVQERWIKTIQERQKNNPEYLLAGPWQKTDYCIPLKKFAMSFRQNQLLSPNEKDLISWDEFVKLYLKKFTGSSALAAKRVDPFSEADKKSGRSGPTIKLTALPDGSWTAEYAGPLYYACAGGQCRAQGYQIAIAADGKLQKFIDCPLYYWNGFSEILLEKADIERLITISNDKDQLKNVYEWAKGKQAQSFTAGMSKLSQMGPGRAAGNSLGTFVLHLSKIRAAIPTSKDWPIYDGPAPGGD